MMPLCHYLFIGGLNQYSDSGFPNVAIRMMPISILYKRCIRFDL